MRIKRIIIAMSVSVLAIGGVIFEGIGSATAAPGTNISASFTLTKVGAYSYCDVQTFGTTIACSTSSSLGDYSATIKDLTSVSFTSSTVRIKHTVAFTVAGCTVRLRTTVLVLTRSTSVVFSGSAQLVATNFTISSGTFCSKIKTYIKGTTFSANFVFS